MLGDGGRKAHLTAPRKRSLPMSFRFWPDTDGAVLKYAETDTSDTRETSLEAAVSPARAR